MWSLTDFTDENGGTRVFRHSHRWTEYPEFNAHPANAAGPSSTINTPLGSATIWHGSLWHGAGANDTETPRVGVAVNYCSGFDAIRPEQHLINDRSGAAYEEPLASLIHDDRTAPRQPYSTLDVFGA